MTFGNLGLFCQLACEELSDAKRLVNKFWCARVPNLRPTAGYYQDGRRFLEDISGAIDTAAVDRAILVRSR